MRLRDAPTVAATCVLNKVRADGSNLVAARTAATNALIASMVAASVMAPDASDFVLGAGMPN